MSDLYAHRENQNNQRFDELALTLRLFRTTVDEINAGVQAEDGILASLNDGFGLLMSGVKRTSGELRNVMNRNASLTRMVGIVLGMFLVVWMLWRVF